MSPDDIRQGSIELQSDLRSLMHKQLGMGNYKEIMAEYQRILNNLIVYVREIAEILKGEGEKNG